MDRSEVSKEIDVGEADFLPSGGIFRPDAGVDENHDTVANGDELFGLADDFGDRGARVGQISLSAFSAGISASTWEFRGFAPVDILVEGFDGSVDVAPVESSIGGTEDGDALFGLRILHGGFVHVIAPDER